MAAIAKPPLDTLCRIDEYRIILVGVFESFFRDDPDKGREKFRSWRRDIRGYISHRENEWISVFGTDGLEFVLWAGRIKLIKLTLEEVDRRAESMERLGTFSHYAVINMMALIEAVLEAARMSILYSKRTRAEERSERKLPNAA